MEGYFSPLGVLPVIAGKLVVSELMIRIELLSEQPEVLEQARRIRISNLAERCLASCARIEANAFPPLPIPFAKTMSAHAPRSEEKNSGGRDRHHHHIEAC
jgi:hypothetical protein